MWFHRDARADEWLLYAQESPSMSGARAFCTAHLFTRAGELVVSVAQEGLVRPVRPR
jgi:acyl-CoA thioesterase-2